MTTLSKAISTTLANRNLTVAAAARSVGLTPLGLARTLRGDSVPNARTLPKYAKLLRISLAKIQAMLESTPTRSSTTNRPTARSARQRSAAPSTTRSPTRGGRITGATAKALATVRHSLVSGEALAGDALAVAVHRSRPAKRAAVAKLLGLA
jgi:transcriptional regulator with XRE-family HTH domain